MCGSSLGLGISCRMAVARAHSSITPRVSDLVLVCSCDLLLTFSVPTVGLHTQPCVGKCKCCGEEKDIDAGVSQTKSP